MTDGKPYIPLVDPDGNLVDVHPDDVQAALGRGGYTSPSPEHFHEEELQKKYGEGILPPIAAGVAGAARGATLGLSDVALTKSGLVEPETLKELDKRNPISSTVGEVAGMVAPALMTDGASIPGAIAKLTPAKGLAVAGKAAESAAAKVLGNIGGKAVGSALEGALIGAGGVVTEYALGDPELTAEKALAHVGLSTLLGGALGAGVGLFEEAIPGALSFARKAVDKVSEVASGVSPQAEKVFAKAAGAVSGKSEEDILQVLQRRHEVMTTPAEKSKVASELADAMNEQYHAVEKASKTARDEVRGLEMERLVEATPEAAQEAYGGVAGRVTDLAEQMRAMPERYPARVASQLEEFAQGLTRDFTEGASPEAVYKRLDDLKGDLDKKIKFGTIPSSDELDAKDLVKGLRSDVKQVLQDESLWGKAGARQAAYNDQLHDYLNAQKEFRHRFMYKSTGKGGSVNFKVDPVKVNSFLNQIADPRGALRSQVFSEFDSASRKLLDQIEASYKAVPEKSFDKGAMQSLLDKNVKVVNEAQDKAQLAALWKSIGGNSDRLAGANPFGGAVVGGMLGGPVGAAIGAGVGALKTPALTIQRLAKLEKAAQAVTERVSSLSKRLTSDVLRVPKVSSEATGDVVEMFKKRSEPIRMLSSDPEGMIDRLAKSTGGLTEHAPATSDGIGRSSAAALAFLAGALPQVPQGDPFATEHAVSPSEASDWNALYNVVQDPTLILKHASQGTLTPAEVGAVAKVYPKLYAHMQQQVLSSISDRKGKPIPYRSQVMATMILGAPGAGAQAMQRTQAAWLTKATQPQAQGGQGGRGRPSAAGKITLGSRSAVGSSRIINRK